MSVAVGISTFAQLALAAAGRVENTTLTLPLTPQAEEGYKFVTSLASLTFSNPIALASPPGDSQRLFVVEQGGRIMVITNLAQPTKALFLDVSGTTIFAGERGLLGLAFHPNYASNGRFFVFRTCMARTGNQTRDWLHDRLSEFRVSSTNENRANPTEAILFQQYDSQGNHNGGDLHFGPDGYLYVSLGDEGGANDQGSNSQKITKDLFAGILRLDVDNRQDSIVPTPHPAVVAGAYRIPADNPFVGATTFLGAAIDTTKLRAEYWAVGLRNPWRISFDSLTGELWVGDVGQGVWESVFVTRAGANHGWAFREGPAAGPKAGVPDGFLTDPVFNYVAPIYSYDHGSGTMRGNAIIGGRVYRGTRFPALQGEYIFADYGSGNVWSLRRRSGLAPLVNRLTGESRITAFGIDPRNGDILACVASGSIKRLVGDGIIGDGPLPPTLAETGAFANLQTLTPNPGIVPYWIRLPFWSDSASKTRWFCVPSTNQFLTYTNAEAFGSPPGTVWIKHFSMMMTSGVASSVRRLETRFLVRNETGAYGVTYRWNSATNAVLVPEEGAEEMLTRVVDGLPVNRVWRYPSRAECMSCHTAAAGYSLSFTAAQTHQAANRTLATMIRDGYFWNPPSSTSSLRPLKVPTDESVSLHWRARSWLAVNCSYCHRPGGGGGGLFDLRLDTLTDRSGMINGALNDDRGDPANRVVVPGDLVHSQLWQRLQSRGPGQMPPLATVVADPDGVAVVRRWIQSLATPTLTIAPRLFARPTGEGLRLEILQPADRVIWIETADTLDSDTWEVRDVPGLEEASFPLDPQGIEVDLAPGESRFFRVRAEEP